MTLHRRSFLTGLGALVAAPAIVSVSNIMPVKVMPREVDIAELFRQGVAEAERIMARNLSHFIYADDAHAANFGLSRIVDETTDSIYLRGGQERWQWTPISTGITVEI